MHRTARGCFGLDDHHKVRSDWEDGRRLRGWVARTDEINLLTAAYGNVFGEKVPLPPVNPSFDFVVPNDGSLPLDGAVPSIINRRGKPRAMAAIADLDARLESVTLEHPDPVTIRALYQELKVDRAPQVVNGSRLRYRALIKTPAGSKELT
ncbi:MULTISPECIES: VOC family protein [unclassified Bradyrhizobium]|uniref:VOC family protein n=1 Tax=unclassified Bradyrhizobium TaxID=2631580 RepID=UPI0028E9D680|nr:MULTISPECIES: VOC family protein [unclassified Bradyrhizobium]